MSDQRDDPLQESFNRWLLGLFLLFVIFFAGSAAGALFVELGVPFGAPIGGVAGGGVVFLAISYWYYGR